MNTNKYKSVDEFSPYKVTWLYFTPITDTFALKQDVKKIEGYASLHKKYMLRFFASKERAISFIENFNEKLGKRYKVRLFTDAQFKRSEFKDGEMIIPFTKKQNDEFYYIG